MMQSELSMRRLLLVAILATCVSDAVSLTSRERRRVGVEESSQRSDKTRSTTIVHGPKRSQNEITTEAGRKVFHRMIGGHLRSNAKQETEEPFWDDGILLSSSGNGKRSPDRREDEEEKKTLSQQVKEGKYGLIQNEIYKKRSKRPGIISYLANPEVPRDTVDNLGGLEEDEIWLAENHVLVLRGGKFPGHETTQENENDARTWPPIDDYKAPSRPVKIPSKPKVPPPFPVQLTEGGPIQIIGTNGAKEIVNSTNDYEKDRLFPKGLLPDDPLFTAITNGTTMRTDPKDSKNDTSKEDEDIKILSPPPGNLPPFYHAIPPGAVFVPPPSNLSDYDEEDQSIYYPPPYSFQYQQDNTSTVPPGPLVPGIILPPPPDFFSALDEKKSSTKKYSSRPATTPLSKPRPTYLPPRKLTAKEQKATATISNGESRSPPIIVANDTRPLNTEVDRKNQTSHDEDGTTGTTREDTKLYNIATLTDNRITNRENKLKKNETELITGKRTPTVSHRSTSTQSTLEKPLEVTPASIKATVTASSNPNRIPSQASYYFYEESSEEPMTTPPTSFYYKTTSRTPFFRTVTSHSEKRKQYQDLRTVPSKETVGDFNAEFVDSMPRSTKLERAQGQRMLPDRAPVYYETGRPFAQPYYSTAKPQISYRQDGKPKPIYQYSFEATDYSSHGNQRQRYSQRLNSYNEYGNVRIANEDIHGQGYDYDNNESVPSRESGVYKVPVYPSTTSYPVMSTTANPRHEYYTQQEERLLDDVTKEYFTIFGKKLPHKTVPSTTPIYSKSNRATERPDYYLENVYNGPPGVQRTPNVKVRYGDQSQRPYSLKDDILVNYRRPLPPINPDSEFISVINPRQEQSANYELADTSDRDLGPIRAYTSQRLMDPRDPPATNYVPVIESAKELDEDYPRLPISLAEDIEVNYRDPRPAINPDAEYIEPLPENAGEKPKTYFAYKLPGDSGHFYFLTPQAITQRTGPNLYPKSRDTRLLRLRRRPGNV